MKDLELSKEIWKIVDAIKKDSEEGAFQRKATTIRGFDRRF